MEEILKNTINTPTEKKEWIKPEMEEVELNSGISQFLYESAFYRS